MSKENLQQTALKQKMAHEAREFVAIFLFLAVFFEAFATYRVLLLRQYQVEYFSSLAAIVSALVLAKIIMIGEYAGLGKRHEQRPLIVSTIYKALVFGILAMAFHVLEDAIKALIHHKGLAEAFEGLRLTSGRYELLSHGLILFCVFVPFFAIRELRRVLGGHQLGDLFFRRHGNPFADAPSGPQHGVRP